MRADLAEDGAGVKDPLMSGSRLLKLWPLLHRLSTTDPSKPLTGLRNTLRKTVVFPLDLLSYGSMIIRRFVKLYLYV